MRVVVVSGYFNPIHSGHLDYLEAASNLGDHLVVIVNNYFQPSILLNISNMFQPFQSYYRKHHIK